MENQTDFLTRLLTGRTSGLSSSINDLRDKEFSGIRLNAEEKLALANFDRYRINVLNSQLSEDKFHHTYRQLQVIANLSDWREFLKPEFMD